LGWALGIVSTLIVAAIQRRTQISETNSVILAELDELRNTLAWTSFRICAHTGKVDDTYLSWFQSVTSEYRGALRDEALDAVLGKLSELSGPALQTAIAQHQPKNNVLGLKRFLTPAIGANLQHLGGFPEEYQRLLFDVVRKVEAINQEVQQADYFFKLSFDTSLDEHNMSVAKSNLDAAYVLVNKLARWSIESIDRLEKYRRHEFAKTIWLRELWRRDRPAA